ncbi:hypothetical protein NPIL_633771 [Nephila pilipes]|uniref:Uncharacterized protein n=1 Tax=Nephila pilipes TaxID=299642 RepID=A0A8X6PSI1_NEPPI|nr:hypothetical protein NPIL_633771 [Nephila pilipes]
MRNGIDRFRNMGLKEDAADLASIVGRARQALGEDQRVWVLSDAGLVRSPAIGLGCPEIEASEKYLQLFGRLTHELSRRGLLGVLLNAISGGR